MYDPATTLMQAMANEIEAHETRASILATLARDATATGRCAIAGAFVAHCHLHRVKGLTLDAQLGALVERYGPLHLEQG